jgi:hypothetical protein
VGTAGRRFLYWLADSTYFLRHDWDTSLLARLIIYLIAAYGLLTAVLIFVEYARDTRRIAFERSTGHQLLGCWVAALVILSTLLTTFRMFEPLRTL